MAIFDLGMKILLASTSVFFLIFFGLCFGWSKMKHPKIKINLITATAVSFLYSFLFFLGGSFLLALISLIFRLWKFSL